MTDGTGMPMVSWRLLGCQIVSVQFDNLTYKSEGDVLTITLEVTSDRVIYPNSSSNALATTPLFSALQQFTGIPVAAILNNPIGALGSMISGNDPTSNAVRNLLNQVSGSIYGGGTNIGTIIGGGLGHDINNFMTTLSNTSLAASTIGRIFS